MKKLFLALAFVFACGTTTAFANESDSPEQIYKYFKQYDYEIVVWKQLRNNGSGPTMMQILHKEVGRNTMSFINNRINALKQSYPGTPQEPITVMNMIPYEYEPGDFYDPIITNPNPNVPFEEVIPRG
ncbi:hypothetical protein [Myroides sp. WP-1]|uniref:hypothetical protein n=1 Tax=Myroides sp. WP-1 TaxID=2759944 RepID=UPI0015FCA516|nr:hypothetical protein [Myroides sp. WP-1]MBB1139181.1 hypothetical protein [Myroides sp. WP-1]